MSISVIADRQAEIDSIHAEIFGGRNRSKLEQLDRPASAANGNLSLSDAELIAKARDARDGRKFSLLFDVGDYRAAGYKSESEADLGLCNLLAFWTGPDHARIEALFSQSALADSKWNRPRYREVTIERAVASRRVFYTPPSSRGDSALNVNIVSNGTATPNGQVAQINQDNLEPPVPFEQSTLRSLPDDILPSTISDQVKAVAAFTETPIELAFFDALGAMAGCTQDKFVIEGRDGYREPLNIWNIAALRSGNRKTAVMNAMAEPLINFEREEAKRLAPLIEAAQQRRNLIEKRIEEFEKKAARAKEDNEFHRWRTQAEELRDTLPQVPRAIKLWEQDITPEQLGVKLAENNGAISIISDEGGIFDILGGLYNPNGTANLDNFLKAHSGSPIRVARVGRAPIDIPNPVLTMTLSPQPDVLRGLVAKPQFRGRGLLARPLYALPNSLLGNRTNEGPAVPSRVSAAYRNCLQTILRIAPRRDEFGEVAPYVLTLSEEAYQTWHAFQQVVEKDMREDGRLAGITDWAGKLPGQLLRIAGNLQIASHSSDILDHLVVPNDLMKKVVNLGEILIDHARAAFGLMSSDPAIELAQKIWHHIEKRRIAGFRERHVLGWLKPPFKNMELIRPALDALVDHGYLEEGILRTTNSRGRPAGKNYTVCGFFRSQWK